MKFDKVLSERFKRHKHDWEEVETSVGHSNFQGIAGGNQKVRVKAVIEKCKECGKERAYLLDGNGTKHPVDPEMVKEEYNEV
jgi:hypothetical protein